MPRKKKEKVWQHYTSTSNKSVKCNYCDKVYVFANVTKMEKHLKVCSMGPPVVDDDVIVKSEENISSTLNNDASMSDNNTEEIFVAAEESTENRSITIILKPENDLTPVFLKALRQNVAEQVTNAEATSSFEIQEDKTKHLDLLLAKAIFVTGAPFSMLEHPLWLNFFEKLHQSYKPPSRENVATTYFDEVYKQMETEISKDLRSASNLHLLCDGWSNQRVEGTFNFLIAKPELVFIKSVNTISYHHTSHYLSQQILTILNEYGAHHFASLVGDNDKTVQKAFDIVKNRHSHIITLKCVAHTINLLCEDCLKPELIAKFMKNVVNIIKTVKKSQLLSSLLAKIIKDKGSDVTLKLPVKTRWDSYYNVLKSLQETKVALQTLAVHEKVTMLIKSEHRAHILDADFWAMVEDCIKLLQPLKEIIFKLETKKIQIYEVYLAFRDLKSSLNFVLPDWISINNVDKDNILNAVDTRMRDCIAPIHLAAYMLDPRTQGAELDENQEMESLQFINEMGELVGGDVMTDLAQYRAKDGLWGKSFVWKSVRNMKPVVWWKGICGSRPLSKIAVRILTVPCTSATSEHTFSNLGHIHDAKQNGLTTERAERIPFIAHNWNINKEIENTNTENENCNSSMLLVQNPLKQDQEPSTSLEPSDNFDVFDVKEMDIEDDSDTDSDISF